MEKSELKKFKIAFLKNLKSISSSDGRPVSHIQPSPDFSFPCFLSSEQMKQNQFHDPGNPPVPYKHFLRRLKSLLAKFKGKSESAIALRQSISQEIQSLKSDICRILDLACSDIVNKIYPEMDCYSFFQEVVAARNLTPPVFSSHLKAVARTITFSGKSLTAEKAQETSKSFQKMCKEIRMTVEKTLKAQKNVCFGSTSQTPKAFHQVQKYEMPLSIYENRPLVNIDTSAIPFVSGLSIDFPREVYSTISELGTLSARSIKENKEIFKVQLGMVMSPVDCCHFSPGSRSILVSNHRMGSLNFYSATEGQLIKTIRSSVSGPGSNRIWVANWADDETVVAGFEDGSVGVFSFSLGKEISHFKVSPVLISSLTALDERTLLCGDHNGNLKCVGTINGELFWEEKEWHRSKSYFDVISLSSSENPLIIATGSSDQRVRTMRINKTKEGERKDGWSLEFQEKSVIRGIVFVPGDSYLAVLVDNQRLSLLSTSTGDHLYVFTSLPQDCRSLVLCPSTKDFFVGDKNGFIHKLTLKTA